VSDGSADPFARARNHCLYLCWTKKSPAVGEGVARSHLPLVVRALATTRPPLCALRAVPEENGSQPGPGSPRE